jgi:holo-[acyl-carrier protein] synthase
MQMKSPHIGVDIIEKDRVRTAVTRWGDRFLKRVYTGPELALYAVKLESLAVRFAGKEAAYKALGGPGQGSSWQDVEILPDSQGKPVVNLYGLARERAKALGLAGLEISLSHSREYAIALVIGIREE